MIENDHARMSAQLGRGLRERKKRDKLARIERAGRALFAERGFERTTTRALAELADIGVGTLFAYFPEKRDLLLHLFLADLEAVQAEALRATRADAALGESLRTVFGHFYAYYARDPRLSRVFLKELVFVDTGSRARLAHFTARFLGELAQLVAVARERGEIRADVEPGRAAYSCFGLYYFTLIHWAAGGLPDASSAEEVFAQHLDLLMSGLQGRSEADAL